MKEIKLRPSLRYWLIMNFPYFLMIVVLFFCGTLVSSAFYLREIIGVGILVLSFLMMWNIIVLMHVQFIIQEEQLIIKRGVLRRSTNFLEMYRVYDYEKKQNIIEVILGIMNVIILSRDLSSPKLVLYGVPNNDKLIPLIRQLVERQKELKQIYEINNPL